MRSTRSRGRRALARLVGLGTLAAVAVLGVGSAVSAQPQASSERTVERALPEHVADLMLDQPVAIEGFSRADLGPDATGSGRVIVRLSADSGAQAFAKGRDAAAAKRAAQAQQDAFLARAEQIDPNAQVVARVQMVLNAVFVEVDFAKLAQIAADPAVVRVAPVGSYEVDLSETVPYIGAEAVQDAGVKGKGVKVAVLDSGVDYTHRAFGGSGNVSDFTANNPDVVEPGTFPTAKIKGGYDFVGGAWIGGAASPPEAPDADPLDAGSGRGHGSHVAHIIGGAGGVAPSVDLYAVKVCSSISTSCSGVALIQGMEWAVDPDGNGNLKDRMHLINMSLGAPYGQPFDDDLSAAVDNATAAGILTVASAGNSADKPYANGTPGAADTALSVAQTQVPSATGQYLVVNGVSYPAVFQPWSSPLRSRIQAPMQFGNGANGNTLGCNAFTPGSLSGKIVLVLRGTCTFQAKIENIAAGGGLAGIIGLVAPGSPFEGGGNPGVTIPGYQISQASSNAIRAAIAAGPATGVLDPANPPSLVKQMVGSSSRGPQHDSAQRIKPEIGAPGASVSAIAGTGTGEGPFGGTSGAAPMVTGSAALLFEGFGGVKTTAKGTAAGKAIGLGLTPVEVKALLMNNAETNITQEFSSDLAPITRIGGGEVRADSALDAPVAAWDSNAPTGALGFGFVDVTDSVTMKKTVRIRNYENKGAKYTITPTFRFADDSTNGAVSVSAPGSVDVKPGRGRDTTFEVTLTIDGSKLRGNSMSSGTEGANPNALTRNEYDGYLVLASGSDTLKIPWHVLPRKAANVVPSTTSLTFPTNPQVIGLNNTGAGAAQNDAYALVATSPNLPEGGRGQASPTPDIRAVGVNTIPVPAGFCSASASFIWAFAINSHERQEHLVPVSYDVLLDIDQDGDADFDIFNFDASLSSALSDGRQLTFAANLTTGAATAFFTTEHSTNTGNTVLYVCAEQLGMRGADMIDPADPASGNKVDIAVLASDWYNGGPGDAVADLTVTPLGERFFGLPSDVAGKTTAPSGLAVYDFGLWPGNTPELGLLLVTNGDRGAGARGGATKGTEALLFRTP